MSLSILVIFLSLLPSVWSSCPSGFFPRDDETCISPISLEKADRITAYDKCGSYNSYPYISIRNAFTNEFIRNLATNESLNGFLWLGLVCSSNDITSCLWDDGTQMSKTSYQNFMDGGPSDYLGKCVAMKISSGYWYSARCTDDVYFGCTYKPQSTPQIPLSCSFMIDWQYLGSGTRSITEEYSNQQTYVGNVASMLYANPSVNFEGNFGFYGSSDQCSISNFDYFPTYPQFFFFLGSHNPSTDCQLDLCDALDKLNQYKTPVGTENPCLVFISGENSSSFLSCSNSLNKSKFQSIFGVSLNAENGVTTLTNNTIPISTKFNADDAVDTVNMILSVVRN